MPTSLIAERAFYHCSQRDHAEIYFLEDVLRGDGFPEARPTRAGVEFRFRIKERVAAIDAAVQPRRMLIVERTEKGELGRGAPRYIVLQRRELLLPFGFVLPHLPQRI